MAGKAPQGSLQRSEHTAQGNTHLVVALDCALWAAESGWSLLSIPGLSVGLFIGRSLGASQVIGGTARARESDRQNEAETDGDNEGGGGRGRGMACIVRELIFSSAS